MEIVVRDSGPSIPAPTRERIFATFYQHNRRAVEQQGLGLGLALVKKIIDLYKGDIEIKQTEESGNEIRIKVP